MVLYSWGFFTLNIMITATKENYKEMLQEVIDTLINVQLADRGVALRSMTLNRSVNCDMLPLTKIEIELVHYESII